ncbi:MAG: transcriptional repressor [Planctomycetota bacterium]
MNRRNTSQRRAIRESIELADRPLDANEVRNAASAAVDNLGIATVYRTLKLGVEEGWLRPVELPNAPTRYEKADKAHHHHFECRACHRVYDVPGCPGNLTPLVPEGFALEDHEIILYGLCKDCV